MDHEKIFTDSIIASKQKKEIFEILNELVDEMTEDRECLYSSYTISSVVKVAISKLDTKFKNSFTHQDILFIISNFADLIKTTTLVDLCNRAIQNEDSIEDCLSILDALETNKELFYDPENQTPLLNLTDIILSKYHSSASIPFIKATENLDLQNELWGLLNLNHLKDNAWNELLVLDWEVLPHDILIDILDFLWENKEETFLITKAIPLLKKYGADLPKNEIIAYYRLLIKFESVEKYTSVEELVNAYILIDSCSAEDDPGGTKEELIVQRLTQKNLDYESLKPLEDQGIFQLTSEFDEHLQNQYGTELEDIGESKAILSELDESALETIEEDIVLPLYYIYKNLKNGEAVFQKLMNPDTGKENLN